MEQQVLLIELLVDGIPAFHIVAPVQQVFQAVQLLVFALQHFFFAEEVGIQLVIEAVVRPLAGQ